MGQHKNVNSTLIFLSNEEISFQILLQNNLIKWHQPFLALSKSIQDAKCANIKETSSRLFSRIEKMTSNAWSILTGIS